MTDKVGSQKTNKQMTKNHYIFIGILVVMVLVVTGVLWLGTKFSPGVPETSLPNGSVQESVSPEPGASELSGSGIVILNTQNNSGEAGIALITETDDGMARVDLGLRDMPTGVPQPAHLYRGSCVDLGDIAYFLSDVLAEQGSDGMSETVLDVSWDQLKSELPLALSVYKSTDEENVSVACGDLIL